MARPAQAGTSSTELMIRSSQKMFVRIFPKYLREGPWHPVAQAVVATLLVGLAATRRKAFQDAEAEALDIGRPLLPRRVLRAVRAAGAAWSCSVLAFMLRTNGAWPLISYTMQSWTLMTVRFTLGALAPHEERPRKPAGWHRAVLRVNEALRFPSLAQNSVTVVVWWLALVPIILTGLGKDARRRAAFLKWNTSPLLLNVHGLNLPLAAADHLLSPRRLLPSDLWLAVAAASAYAAFYLSCLDPRGLHLYIILSPRTKLSAVSCGALLAAYAALHWFWDSAARAALRLPE